MLGLFINLLKKKLFVLILSTSFRTQHKPCQKGKLKFICFWILSEEILRMC